MVPYSTACKKGKKQLCLHSAIWMTKWLLMEGKLELDFCVEINITANTESRYVTYLNWIESLHTYVRTLGYFFYFLKWPLFSIGNYGTFQHYGSLSTRDLLYGTTYVPYVSDEKPFFYRIPTVQTNVRYGTCTLHVYSRSSNNVLMTFHWSTYGTSP